MHIKNTLPRVFILGICLLFPALAGLYGEPEPGQEAFVLRVPETVVQGDILMVLLRGPWSNIRSITAELADGAGKTSLSFSGFRFPPPGIVSGEYWAAPGGISSVQAPGDYEITLNLFFADGRRTALTRPVKILRRDFVREDIPLNQAMSDLRLMRDPRKDAEARELSALLAASNLSSVYHGGSLSLPIAEGFRESSFFGDRRTFLYTDGGKARSVHYGIDYAAPRGTPVYAAGAGRVVMAKERVLTGFSVVIEHLPGVYSLYYHLDKLEVQEGLIVLAGEKIGESGFTGLATGPHLHWEVRAAGNAVDPKTLLGAPLIDKTLLFDTIEEVLEKGR
jgi:murein DD-endopeptidase MepM/ murein hydrolase activator NlpD